MLNMLPRRTVRRLMAVRPLFLIMSALALGAGPAMGASDHAPRDAWRSVGRLWLGNGDVCGVSLVMPGVAATAAHCLFDQRTGEPRPIGDLVVQLDWRDGTPMRRARVAATAIHPDFLLRDHGSLPAVAADAALLALWPDAADTAGSEYYAVSSRRELNTMTVVMVAGRAPREVSCAVHSGMAGVTALQCEVAAGSSGAPVVTVAADGRARLTGVVSASGTNSAGAVTLVSRGVAELVRQLPKLCSGWPSPRPGACHHTWPREVTPDWRRPPLAGSPEAGERGRLPPPPPPRVQAPAPPPASTGDWWVIPPEPAAADPVWAPPEDHPY